VSARAELAALVDHTLLTPEATEQDVAAAAREALELGVAALCVSPNMVAAAAAGIGDAGLPIAAVIGFPSGAHRAEAKASEAELAIADGAAEIDMVIDLGRAAEGRWDLAAAEVAAVRERIGTGPTLKAILETALLDPDQIAAACLAVERGGADFAKTSTGFHRAGGVSLAAVRTMAASLQGRLGIKASGGIGDAAFARELVAAGATRLGMSRTAEVLAELDDRA
jgi:deoxyribose-phosphate aldolase